MAGRVPLKPDPTILSPHLSEMREALRRADPQKLADNTATRFAYLGKSHGEFQFDFLKRKTVLAYPELIAFDIQTGEEVPVANEALLLYYFITADGAPFAYRWISFSELPDGRFYTQAFQGYTGRQLALAFNEHLQAFAMAAVKAAGVRLDASESLPGDANFLFQILPRVDLLVACWAGDEDFPPSFNILFDASISHYLPTDACAVLGSTLTRRIIAARLPTEGQQ